MIPSVKFETYAVSLDKRRSKADHSSNKNGVSTQPLSVRIIPEMNIPKVLNYPTSSNAMLLTIGVG